MLSAHKSHVSAYLLEPATPSRVIPVLSSVSSLRPDIHSLRQANPHLLGRTFTALAIWCALVSTYQGFMARPAASTPSATLVAAGASPAPVAKAASLVNQLTVAPVVTTAVARPVHAAVLPSGPSGQLLPPGTMAPDRSYPNSYARGQCTWYVASRRQVPSNWGNAASWYYHATASGWSVGTVPAVAAIAWTPAGRYGHVALVEQVSPNGSSVYVSEMNYRGVGIKSFRWVPAKDFKYIY